MSTDDPNQMLPPAKHTNIQKPSDIVADIRRAQRHQEDQMDRMSVVINRMSVNLDILVSRRSWVDYIIPLLIGLFFGLLIGWTT